MGKIFAGNEFYNTKRYYNLQCMLVTAHLCRNYFRNINFHVYFNYNQFLKADTSECCYTFYDAEFGFRSAPQNSYRNKGNLIDVALKKMLMFKLYNSDYIKKCYKLISDVEAIPLIKEFNAPFVAHQENQFRATKDPIYRQPHPDSININDKESPNEWKNVSIAREFVYCFKSVELVTNIGFFTYKTKLVDGTKILLAHYRPWLNSANPQATISNLYPRLNGTRKIDNVNGKKYEPDFQQEFYLEIGRDFTHLILKNYYRQQLDHIAENQTLWKNYFNAQPAQPKRPADEALSPRKSQKKIKRTSR